MAEKHPRKRILYQKSGSWVFVYIAYKEIISICRWKLLSRILVQFPYKLSTTMFVLIKNWDYRRRRRTNRFTFILLLFIVPLLSLIQLIASTNLHPNTKKFHGWQKKQSSFALVMDELQLARFRTFMKPLSTGLGTNLNLACFCRNNLKPKLYYRKINTTQKCFSVNQQKGNLQNK